MMQSKKAVVIGAGIAGLSVAIRLRKQGYLVDVYEANDAVGGKAGEYHWNGFRFDCGPSLFTLPELVDDLFILCNKSPRTYFEYKTLEVITKYFFGDGLEIDSYSNPEKFAQEAQTKLNTDPKIIIDFLNQQAKTYNTIAPVFLENSIHRFSKLLKKELIKPLLHLINPRFLKKLHKVNAAHFKEKPLVKIFDRYGTYNGSNPYQMPSLFNIISHLEHNVGAYLPTKGIHAIPNALYQLAVEEGVNFHFSVKVEKIVYDKDSVNSIVVNGTNINADIVVSNMDVTMTYSKLMPDYKAPTLYLNNPSSTSAMIFHWAVDMVSPSLEVHNILFAEDYEAEFQALFGTKKPYLDPTIYIYISSKIVANDAPTGKENWFVMVNMPAMINGYFDDKIVDVMREKIFTKINDRLKINIESVILHEHITTPKDISSHTSAHMGSLYGANSNSILSAFWRHPNFSNFKNLYFCGGTVHPGGGIPLCLLSAKIAADLIQEDHER